MDDSIRKNGITVQRYNTLQPNGKISNILKRLTEFPYVFMVIASASKNSVYVQYLHGKKITKFCYYTLQDH
jgi:hypothetical protein